MKMVDQNIRTKKEEETLTNTLSFIFTESNEDEKKLKIGKGRN